LCDCGSIEDGHRLEDRAQPQLETARGALERLQAKARTKMLGTHLLEGAEHWAHQGVPEQVTKLTLRSFCNTKRAHMLAISSDSYSRSRIIAAFSQVLLC
jgi:hypothetical protein